MEKFKKSPDRQKEVSFLSELRQLTTFKRTIITSLIIGSIGLLSYFALRKNSSDQSPETPSIEKFEKRTQEAVGVYTSSTNQTPDERIRLILEKIGTASSQKSPAQVRLNPTNFLILQELAETHPVLRDCLRRIAYSEEWDWLTNEQWKELNLIIEKIITEESKKSECSFHIMRIHYYAEPKIEIRSALRDGYISEEAASTLYDLIKDKTREEALDFLKKNLPDPSILDRMLNTVVELVESGMVSQSEWEVLLAMPHETVEEIQAKLKAGKELGKEFGVFGAFHSNFY